MQVRTFIDVIPQGDGRDRYQVGVFVEGPSHAYPTIRGVDVGFVCGRLGQLGWSLLRERFESRGRLENEVVDVSPAQLELLGFTPADVSLLLSAGLRHSA